MTTLNCHSAIQSSLLQHLLGSRQQDRVTSQVFYPYTSIPSRSSHTLDNPSQIFLNFRHLQLWPSQSLWQAFFIPSFLILTFSF